MPSPISETVDGKPLRPYSHPATSAAVVEIILQHGLQGKRVLDVGAGQGYFASLVGAESRRQGLEPADVLTACDLNPESFRYTGCSCLGIDANGRLPFPDASFDFVCSIEVVEHLEDQFAFARELFRVVKPGGRVIITTPNVLNINSRIRTLICGFPLLFNPLKTGASKAGGAVHASTGHIHPVAYYFLDYQFRQAGFREVNFHYDRLKRSAYGWMLLLSPILLYGQYRFHRNLKREKLDGEPAIPHLNSMHMLAARTVIVEGVRAS